MNGATSRRLAVDGLRIVKSGTDTDVIADVSFSVDAGEVVGLVGESGSGKTTAALALLGYARRGLEITAGSVFVDGVDVLTLKGKDLRSLRGGTVAYVPQDPGSALNPALRLRTQLQQAFRAHSGDNDEAETRFATLLHEVNLPASREYLNRYPHQLSGGQQQRVALALAFMWRPSLIVLDEPTTGLDVSTQRHVLSTIRELCEIHEVGGVFVSHDLAVVGGLASSVAVMYAGRIVEFGRTADVFGDPAHPYTRGLLDALPSPDQSEALRGIEGQPPQPGRRPQGCSFAPRCPLCRDECVAASPPAEALDGRTVRCYRAGENPVWAQRRTRVGAIGIGSDTILRVDGLCARYGATEVVHDVSFEVPANACVAVVGESGSGKTTLAGCISGLHTDLTGSMGFRNEALVAGVSGRSRETLRSIQYVFQNPYASLNPRKTIGQIIAQPLDHHLKLSRAEREARIAAVLGDLSLPHEFISRFPDQLSGGERQRVAIARALAVDPTLLICDEVTSALDVSVQAVIVEMLRRLQAERNLSLIFVTHDLALVRSIAQYVVVISDGSVVEIGLVDHVLDRPEDPYTIRLIEDIPRLEAARS